MNKEEILEASRKENKTGKDEFEKKVERDGQYISLVVIVCLCMVFLALEIFSGKGVNYGLFAIPCAGCAALYWVRYRRMPEKVGLAAAILLTAAAVLLTAAYIIHLFRV